MNHLTDSNPALAASTLASDLAESAEWSECTVEEYKRRCAADVRTFQATGELPPAWTPERSAEDMMNPDLISDEELDRRVDEINREIEAEREAIESGSVEPPRLGWNYFAPLNAEAARYFAELDQEEKLERARQLDVSAGFSVRFECKRCGNLFGARRSDSHCCGVAVSAVSR
jgi:hypothetical protein